MPPRPQKMARTAGIGVDGRTLGERLQLCMALKRRELGREFTQKEVVEASTRAAGMDPETQELFTQQMFSKLLNGESQETAHVPALAAVFRVEPLWLAYGQGPATLLEGTPPDLR